MLRVVGGKYRSRKLEQPPLEITRPTKDVVKEAMFNSLGDLSGKSFLDCFGGSGAIGIEAYSRGACEVVIIEQNKSAYKIISKNLKTLGIDDIKILNISFDEYLRRDEPFDFVFIDPPYKYEINDDFLEKLFKKRIVNEKTVIIIERDENLDENYFSVFSVKKKKYGRTYLYILRKNI